MDKHQEQLVWLLRGLGARGTELGAQGDGVARTNSNNGGCVGTVHFPPPLQDVLQALLEVRRVLVLRLINHHSAQCRVEAPHFRLYRIKIA